MQESIFYNKEQLKIIRNYGLIHKMLFKYWVALSAWILSIVASFFMLTSGYFSSIYLLETKDTGTISQAQTHFNNKQQQVTSIPGLKGILLNWNLNITNWNIVAEDVLLEKDGLTLPRKTSISSTTLDYYVQWQNKERYNDDYMKSFFQNVLVVPANQSTNGAKNPQLFSLWGSSLKNLFWLECTTTKSSSSFVCKSYVRNFLDRFYLYDLAGATNEISLYFNALSSNSHYKKDMCDWILKYGNFVTDIDNNLSDMFRNCGSDSYNKFVLLRDFLALNKQFSVWYIETLAYNNRSLNEYKLFSLQQMIYRGISTSSDVKSLIQSYIGFLREVLLKEEGRQDALLSPFTKSFAYWFNMNVLSPYFKDEKSKMNKEDRTSLNSDMLTINYWDTVAGYKWLQEASLYKYETTTTTTTKKTTTVVEKQPLKDIFIQSYLPADFNLYSVENWEDENTLLVNWVDLRTEYTINATLKYENLQLFVVTISISSKDEWVNETLTNFINSSISSSKSKYSLNQALTLINDYKDFANKPSDDIGLCDQIEAQFKSQLISCSSTWVVLQSNNIGVVVKEPVIYTFKLNKRALTDVKVSHELLASQLLSTLDLTNVDASSTLYMIRNVMAYKLEDTDTGFWLKEYRAITETIQKYIKNAEIEPENGKVTVTFSAGWVNFSANYDSVKQELNPISIVVQWRRPIIVQGLSLTLKDGNIKEINSFLNDPISKLEKINPALVERYFPKDGK